MDFSGIQQCLEQIAVRMTGLEHHLAHYVVELQAGNAAALETFGIISEETVGFDIFKDEAIPAGLRAALKRGEAIRFRTEFDFSKVTYKTVRNDVANFEFYITPLRDRAGDTIGIMVQTIDLTDTK